ncbi:MAG: tetratricopeptide repeat protein [Cyanobacteria bacterium REEB67]|nr:tetratricopeptide repeat protein [Cyanobacteria bacterium REEB67]
MSKKTLHVWQVASLAGSFFVSGLLSLFCSVPVSALDPADDIGVFGSVTVARSAREALKAMKNQDWSTATSLYRSVIQSKDDYPGFYYGLLFCAEKSGDWPSAAAALEGIAEKDPSAKDHLDFHYGHCYTMTNRPDQAIPYLKVALEKPKDADFLSGKIKDLQHTSVQKAPPLIAGVNGVPVPPVDLQPSAPIKRPVIPGDSLNPYTNDVGLDFENAFRYSEWIGICQYRGYEKKVDTSYFNPPTANFYWTKCLKGPPLNHALPVKFRFCSKDGEKMPEGWKFGPEKMPTRGSQWLIFIPNAVPVAGGFDTYKGSYGRQAATEANVGEVYRIIEAHHGQ